MNIDKKQLEVNFNLHSLNPGFLNLELHYIIASSENSFRFVEWNSEPGENEQKFYCFLVDKEITVPAGNITLKESYVIEESPVYPVATNYNDFIQAIEALPKMSSAKRVRQFTGDAIDAIKSGLSEKYGTVDSHTVTSNEGQHCLLKVRNVDVSIAATMVYFRDASQFTESIVVSAED